MSLVLPALLLAFACEPEVRRGPRPAVPVPGTARSGGAVPPGSPAPVAPGAPDPAGCDPCSLLMQHDVDALIDGEACDRCGASDPGVCDGWPEPGRVPCDRYDWLRNCIYARLGYDFDTAREWRREFDREPWYRPDPAFSWDRVTDVQKRNAERLRDLAKGRTCRR